MKIKYYFKFFVITLFFIFAVYGVTKFLNTRKLKVDLSGKSFSSISARTINCLNNAKGKIIISYYVSSKSKMPTKYIYLERYIKELLEKMKIESCKNLDYIIINMDKRPEFAKTLVNKKITPFTIESIEKDKYIVYSIWSAMIIQYMGKEKIIPFILTEHLPHIQERIVNLVKQIEGDKKPIIALMGTNLASYKHAADRINSFGELICIDTNSKEVLTENADLLFVINPENISERHIKYINTFLESGKNVFVFFDVFQVLQPTSKKSGVKSSAFYIKYISSKFISYLNSMGVYPLKKTIMDHKYSKQIFTVKKEISEEQIEEQFKNIIQEARALGIDTETMLDKMGQSLAESKDSGIYKREDFGLNINPNRIYLNQFFLKTAGRIFVKNAAPIKVDERKLYKSGFNYEPIITSPEDSILITLPEKDGIVTLPKDALVLNNVEILALVLIGEKPWYGKLFLFSNSSLLADNNLNVAGNWNLLRNILITYTNPDKLISIKLSRERKSLIPELNKLSRLSFRFFILLLIPLLIISGALIKKTVNIELLIIFMRSIFTKKIIMFSSLLILIIISKNFITLSFDLTTQKHSILSAETKELLSELKNKIKIIYITSKKDELSYKGKQLVKYITLQLHRFKRHSKKVNFEIIKMKSGEKTNTTIEEILTKYNISTFKLKTIIEDKYIEQDIYSSLIFLSEEKKEVVRNISPGEVNRIEFVFVSAIKRLISGKKPKIAIITEPERLSPAEEFHEYYEKMRPSPKFQNYYSSLEELLINHGYNVDIINSRSNNNFDVDLIFFLQPRIISDFMMKKLNKHLLSGKNAIIATQHYQIIPRRYKGRGFFSLVYWPRPYFTRINDLLEPYGIELKKEVLLDENYVKLDVKGQIYWGGSMEKKEIFQIISEPFLIRALALNFDKKSIITTLLSDQFFIYANRFIKNSEKFATTLNWQELIKTSEQVWANDWKGGFLTSESFDNREYFEKKQPLTVLVEGIFPPIYGNNKLDDKKSKLLLIGNSVMFKNYYLTLPFFEHKNFLLNSVAYMTYDEKTALLQAKTSFAKKGLKIVSSKERLFLRFGVILFPSLLLIVIGLIRKFSRHILFGSFLFKLDI